MSEARHDATGQDSDGALQASLAMLRNQGAWRLDPTRFDYFEELARRLQDQSGEVRRILQHRLKNSLAAYVERLAQAELPALQVSTRPSARIPVPTASHPLALLNDYIRGTSSRDPADSTQGAPPQATLELESVRRFRRAWSNGRTQDQVAAANSRKPAHAGPLNSHMLVLQSLEFLGELSPDYLRRFLTQVESLQWLDRATDKHSAKSTAPGGTLGANKLSRRRRPPK